jgi:ferredoxin
MLVIDPTDCIDCNLCAPECPAEAIVPDVEHDAKPWIALNATYAAIWPSVTCKAGQTPADADSYKGEAGKFDAHFSPKPGNGD